MRKIISMIVVIALLFVFSTTAFAEVSEFGYWNSTICYYGFTTTDSITKASGNYWFEISIVPSQAYWPGYFNWEHKLYVTCKSSTGTIMSAQYVANEAQEKL